MNVHEIREKLTELLERSIYDYTRSFCETEFYLGQRERTQEIINLFGEISTSEVNSSNHNVTERANASSNSIDTTYDLALSKPQKEYLWFLRRMIRSNDSLTARGLSFSLDDVYRIYADTREEREKWQVSRQLSFFVEQGFLMKENERYRLGNKQFEDFLSEIDEEVPGKYPMQLTDDEIPF